ncbi:MAG: hypothetical protein A3D74_01680 [Candidatus Levybacteria bacterium RIFCSPHIGHO2_02_FULL_37_13]|nr:MAG: hypothetical protein A3D74_01680 [Candidatus Levybacteria bacterium RIFCSPHIGHO2_02_FULL_37_13]OGH39647.1 MAG: hypothetical protein A3B41_03980 [Candidatus Levybacteria bacterium RIFCSPLOWO2_01_FULL_37_26]
MPIEREVRLGPIVLKRFPVKPGKNFDSDAGNYGIWWLADRRRRRVNILSPDSVGIITEWKSTIGSRGFGEQEVLKSDEINGINIASRIPGVSYRLKYHSEVSSK